MVGNPANTNCLIAMNNAPDIPRERFTSMMRLDHNRAIAQLANKAGAHVRDVTRHGGVGQPLADACTRTCSTRRSAASRPPSVVDDRDWIEDEFLPTVGKRGAAIIEARGASQRRVGGERGDRPRPRLGARHADGDWVSMGVPSDGSYGVAEGLIWASRAPARAASGRSSRASRSTTSRASIDASVDELADERDTVKQLALVLAIRPLSKP